MLASKLCRPTAARRFGVWAAVATGLVGAVLSNVAGGDEKPPKSVPRPAADASIAILDLKHVFDHDPAFRRAKEEIDVEIKTVEAMVALRKASVEKLNKDRDEHRRDSDDYRRLDEVLTKETVELTAQVQTWRKQFVQREAELYLDTYRRIQKVVDAFVEERGILIVLRFNRAEAEEPGSTLEVAKLLNRPIVAYKKPADITDEILRRLEKAPPATVVRRPKEAVGERR